MDSARGQLLVAGPALLDPNFWRTVVLVIEHTDEGALGLVLNRPSETTVGEAVSQLDELVDPADQLFIGGTWVKPATNRRIQVISPSTEELIASVPAAASATGGYTL